MFVSNLDGWKFDYPLFQLPVESCCPWNMEIQEALLELSRHDDDDVDWQKIMLPTD